MEESDLLDCARVEREAFPTLFPPTSFARELKNRLASYLVVEAVPEMGDEARDGVQTQRDRLIRRLISGAAPTAWRARDGDGRMLGFVGTWHMADEAHIVNFGVLTKYRGNGLGELLLIAAIEQAQARGSSMVTLEVRESNFVARNLYRKYGFTERGLRKAYYSDNREDALIMTTDAISGPAFGERFAGLVAAHELARGASVRRVG